MNDKERRLALECELLETKIAAEKHAFNSILQKEERRGEFSLVGDVSEGSIYVLQREITAYLAAHPEATEIHLTINSGGGVVIEGLALVDYLGMIQRRGVRVKATAIGLCASMASVILQAADERIMTPRAWIGLHEIQSVAAGGMSVAFDRLKWAERLQDQAVELYVAKSKLTRDDIQEMWQRKDVMLNAEEALAHGLIDGIAGGS